jgi:hypothetical protein
MKIKAVSIVALAATFALPVLACGPMISGGGTSSTTGGGREQWTKKRIHVLKERRQHYQEHVHHGGDVRDLYAHGLEDNPYFGHDETALRERAAIKRQHEIDTIEFLAIKKERGELSPAGQHKLNALIRHVRSEGH